MRRLDADAGAAGVVCASAGNHAQGVAYACARARHPAAASTSRARRRGRSASASRRSAGSGSRSSSWATPTTTPPAAAAGRRAAHRGGAGPAVRRPPHDRRSGHASPREIVEQLGRAPDVAGRAGRRRRPARRRRRPGCGERHPATRVVGVEPAGAASMAAALAAGAPGAARRARQLRRRRRGAHASAPSRSRSCATAAASWSTVAEGRICTEMLALYQTDGIIAEPAGALATAALGDAVRPEPGSDRRLRRLRRQQRRQPLRRDRRAVAGPRGPQALLPGRVPAGARRAAPLPRRGARPGRRHHALRVRQAQQPRDRPGAGRHRAGRAATTSTRCWGAWRPRRCTSSGSSRAARCSASCSDGPG